MSALTFTLKVPLQQSVNCSVLTPDNLAGKTIAEIAAIKLIKGKNQLLAGDIFDISGTDTQQLCFKNTTAKLDYIGANMNSGSITVEEDAGAYLGFGLKNGEIHCKGNAAAFAACNMRDGLLKINGNAGDFLGAGSEGLRKGMLGGTVIVKGNVGDRAGDQMRRGLILIEGNTGDYCGSRMVAGTIGVLGELGAYTGFNMHRGTLLLKKQPQLHATIQDCGIHTLPFLSLLFKSFAQYETQFSKLDSMRVQRFVGDLAYSGNGEILVLKT
jgi:formylmethanofuran dehydrogenase subunit C